MPYPSKPLLNYSFTDFQEGQGDNSFPGTPLDDSLFSLKLSTDEIVDFLRGSFRDDGKLGAGSVPPSALAPGTLALIGNPVPRGNWATATAYKVRDLVQVGTSTYLCALDHTSATLFATDQAAGRWLLIADDEVFTGQIVPQPILAESGRALFATGAGTVAWQAIVFPTPPALPEANALELPTPLVRNNTGVDNGTALLQALRTAGRTIVVPAGVYSFASQVNIGLLGSVRLRGEPGAIFRFNNPSQLAVGITVVTGGHDFSVEGITIDADNRVTQPFRVQQVDPIGVRSALSIERMTVQNVRCGAADATGPTALRIEGGFQSVRIRDCRIQDVTRGPTAGTPGTSGSLGIFVLRSSIDPVVLYPRHVLVEGCVIQNVSTEATLGSANNVDCDGIILFGAQAAATVNPGLYIVRDNAFFECAGRAVKAQHDQVAVLDNLIVRSSKPINAVMDISCQTGHGVVVGNVFDYRPWISGTEQLYLDRVTACGVYVGSGGDRDVPVGGVIRDNTVFLTATGTLEQFAWLEQTTTAAEADRAFVAVENNRVLGAAKRLGRLWRFGAESTAKAHALVRGNYIADLTAALLALDFTPMVSARLVVRDNVNHGSTPRDILGHSDGTTPVSVGVLDESGNVGMTGWPLNPDISASVAAVVVPLREGVVDFDIEMNVVSGVAQFTPIMELSFDGGSTWTANGWYGTTKFHDTSILSATIVTNAAGVPLAPTNRLVTSGDTKHVAGAFRLINVASRPKVVVGQAAWWQQNVANNYGGSDVAARHLTGTLATHARFRDAAGANIAAGSRFVARLSQP